LRELFALNDDVLFPSVMDSLVTQGTWAGMIKVPFGLDRSKMSGTWVDMIDIMISTLSDNTSNSQSNDNNNNNVCNCKPSSRVHRFLQGSIENRRQQQSTTNINRVQPTDGENASKMRSCGNSKRERRIVRACMSFYHPANDYPAIGYPAIGYMSSTSASQLELDDAGGIKLRLKDVACLLALCKKDHQDGQQIRGSSPAHLPTGAASAITPRSTRPPSRPTLSRQQSGQGRENKLFTPPSCSWHDIRACIVDHPFVPGSRAIALVQHDMTRHVELPQKLATMLEAEHSLLENIFPCHVLEHITLSSGRSHTEAMASRVTAIEKPHKLASSHENITVLFADVVGFTPMCHKLPADTVMAFLNDLFSRLDDLTVAHGVYKVETIGDCYMAAGGIIAQDEAGTANVRRNVDPHHAQKVISFAKAMIEVVRDMRMPGSINKQVRLRIGVHSGPAMSGVVGNRMPRFCLFGSTVNVASRMESTAVPMTIHASEATQTLTPREAWSEMPLLDVKGVGLMRTFKLEV
jgi:class 3 adenylate cyclase